MERYVSFEVAKLANQAGFDKNTNNYFLKNGIPTYGFGYRGDDGAIPMPTQLELMEWLNENGRFIYDALDRTLSKELECLINSK